MNADQILGWRDDAERVTLELPQPTLDFLLELLADKQWDIKTRMEQWERGVGRHSKDAKALLIADAKKRLAEIEEVRADLAKAAES